MFNVLGVVKNLFRAQHYHTNFLVLKFTGKLSHASFLAGANFPTWGSLPLESGLEAPRLAIL